MRKIISVALSIAMMLAAFANPAGAVYSKANFAYGKIASDSSISYAAGPGSTFKITPNSKSSSFPEANFLIVVYSSSCAMADTCASREIVLISNRNSNTFTIGARNQEGTTHSSDWVANSIVDHVITSGTFEDYAPLVSPIFSGTVTAPNIVSTGTSSLNTVTATTVTASGDITADQLISTMGTGTAPAVVSSTTKVANFNADLVDDKNPGSANGLATLDAAALLAQNAPTGFTIGGNTAWHAGNDGSGSTLDADTVDTVQSANLAGAKTWATSTSYSVGNIVTRGYALYLCVTAHTSGTFATDWYTNGKWVALGAQPGDIKAWGGGAAPPGHLLANKAAVSRTTYADLFAVYGTTYGVGDGSTTFNLPDARGIYLKGAGTTDRAAGVDASGNWYSGVLGTYSQDELQGHTHVLYRENDPWEADNELSDASEPGSPFTGIVTGPASAGRIKILAPYTDLTNGAPRTGHTTEPQNLSVNYIIKY